MSEETTAAASAEPAAAEPAPAAAPAASPAKKAVAKKAAVKNPAKKAAVKNPAKKAVVKKPASERKKAPVDLNAQVVGDFEKALGKFAVERRNKATGVSFWREVHGRTFRLATIYPRPKSVYMHTPLKDITAKGAGFEGTVGKKYKYRGSDAVLIKQFISEIVSSARALASMKVEDLPPSTRPGPPVGVKGAKKATAKKAASPAKKAAPAKKASPAKKVAAKKAAG